jgi:hypothetical protein
LVFINKESKAVVAVFIAFFGRSPYAW